MENIGNSKRIWNWSRRATGRKRGTVLMMSDDRAEWLLRITMHTRKAYGTADVLFLFFFLFLFLYSVSLNDHDVFEGIILYSL